MACFEHLPFTNGGLLATASIVTFPYWGLIWTKGSYSLIIFRYSLFPTNWPPVRIFNNLLKLVNFSEGLGRLGLGGFAC